MIEIKDIPISKLKLLDRNPRKITKEQMEKLCESIKNDPDFLLNRPILVNEMLDGTLQVYAGNQRVRALKQLKWEKAPCIVSIDLSEEAMKSRAIKDNKTYGDWDWDLLANEWEIDTLLEAGFSENELSDYVQDISTDESEEENETLEPVKDEDAITKLGDIYELDGGHIVICGDSTLPENILPHLEKHQPIIMITDPPYGVNYDPNFNKDKTSKQLGKVLNDDNADWKLSFIIFNGFIAYVWSSDKFAFETVKGLVDCDFKIINQIIWAKPSLVLGRGDYHSQHEPCWYAVKKGCKHNWKGDRKQTTLWEIEKVNNHSKNQDERTDHGTQKPIECMARPIRNHTDEGDYVYDPFLGSGTTLIAAEQLKRKCIGVELSPAYCDIIVNRWINWRKKHSLNYNFKRNGIELDSL